MKTLAVSISLLLFLGVMTGCSSDRLTEETKQQATQVQEKLDAESPKTKPAPAAEAAKAAEPAEQTSAKPDIFKVAFETTKGAFTVEVHRDWAPNGADRFEQLVRSGFFNGNKFFRVVPGFVVQWGLCGDPVKDGEWRQKTIKDDLVKQSNTEGMVTFAASGQKDSRSTQVFINFKNNANLDRMGFAPIGKVIDGMDVAKSINAEYREKPDQMRIAMEGNKYLEEKFPDLDYIKSAVIIE